MGYKKQIVASWNLEKTMYTGVVQTQNKRAQDRTETTSHDGEFKPEKIRILLFMRHLKKEERARRKALFKICRKAE